MFSMCGGWQLLSKTLRRHYWDFDEKEIADGVKYGHDAKKLCEYCRSDRLNKRNMEAVKFGGREVRGLAEKVRPQKIYNYSEAEQ